MTSGVLRYRAPDAAHLLNVIDTGKRKAGYSAWHIGRGRHDERRSSRLLGARLVRWTDAHDGRAGWSPKLMASAMLLQAVSYRVHGVPVVWILERPKKYVKKRAQHKDLDSLLAVIEWLRVITGRDRVFTREPGPWKGNLPKAVHHQRVIDAGIFTFDETPIAAPYLDTLGSSYQPDVADAIALGAFEVGRVERGGVTLLR